MHPDLVGPADEFAPSSSLVVFDPRDTPHRGLTTTSGDSSSMSRAGVGWSKICFS